MNGWLIYDDAGYARNQWFIKRMLDAASDRGLSLAFVRAEELTAGVRQGRAFVARAGREEFPSYAICRTIDPKLSDVLEKVGTRVFNSAEVSRVCNDKALTYETFSCEGVPMPTTVFYRASRFEESGVGYPAVFKSPDGHGGSEVFLVENKKEVLTAIQKTQSKEFLLQKVVQKGVDVRVYLLNGEIVAAVKRTSKTDFRSNYSLGGSVELTEPCEVMRSVCDAVYRKLHPFFVGVDFIFDENGDPLLNEIEDVVGTRMLYRLTDKDVAGIYMDELKKALS